MGGTAHYSGRSRRPPQRSLEARVGSNRGAAHRTQLRVANPREVRY
jgi:hypothetical protein